MHKIDICVFNQDIEIIRETVLYFAAFSGKRLFRYTLPGPSYRDMSHIKQMYKAGILESLSSLMLEMALEETLYNIDQINIVLDPFSYIEQHNIPMHDLDKLDTSFSQILNDIFIEEHNFLTECVVSHLEIKNIK